MPPSCPRPQADAVAPVILAAALLILPLPWICAAFIAGLTHEFAHILAVYLCGGKVTGIRIHAHGAVIDTAPMNEGKSLICSLAGPLGGLCLLPLGGIFPRLAFCAAVQSVFNLLPIYPLDGGRAVQGLAGLLLKPGIADRICKGIGIFSCCILLLLGVYAAFAWRMGLVGVALSAVSAVHIRSISRKTPCKHGQFTIQ